MRFVFILLLALCGCATIDQLERRPPDARYLSSKSGPFIAQCLLTAVSRFGQADIAIRGDRTWITLVTRDAYPAARIELMTTDKDKTLVTVRQAIAYSLDPTIRPCL